MSKSCHYVLEKEYITGIKKQKLKHLNSKNDVLMAKLIQFYIQDDNLNKFLNVINNKTKLSLRIIDFFITNYAREDEVIYEVNNQKFMVHYSYKAQLKAFSKKQFDPFCRRERILFFINDYDGKTNKPIKTTVGQLNFFRWAIKNKILDCILANYSEIENKMNKASKKNENKITLSASKKISKHNITITVKFDK